MPHDQRVDRPGREPCALCRRPCRARFAADPAASPTPDSASAPGPVARAPAIHAAFESTPGPLSVGRILLANQPSWFREAYLERELEHPTPKTQTEAATLATELALVREQGHAVTIDEMRLGACSIAVPISHGGQVVAAVGIVLESHRASEVP